MVESSTLLADERARCEGLVGLVATANRLGVSFDARAAIRKGMSVSAARAAILNTAAEGDVGEISAIAPPKAEVNNSLAWKKALR